MKSERRVGTPAGLNEEFRDSLARLSTRAISKIIGWPFSGAFFLFGMANKLVQYFYYAST